MSSAEPSKKAFLLGSDLVEKFQNALVSEGLVSADQLTLAHISRQNLGLDLGTVLIKKGYITEAALLEFVARHLKIPFEHLDENLIDRNEALKLPLALARKYTAIPYLRRNDELLVAMANPFDSFAREDIKDTLGEDFVPVLTPQIDIENQIDKILAPTAGGSSEHSVTMEVSSESDNEGETDRIKMQEMASGPQVVAAVSNIIARASQDGASDIHIEPVRKNIIIRYRIDGLLRERGVLPKTMQMPVVSRIKILAGLDIAERRIPQDGRVRVKLVGKPLDLRISTCPTQFGEKIVIRLLSKDGVRSIESIGFAEKERRLFSDIISKSHGIFLATGPTGSGKSTTLYAALARLNSSEKNIISIEDPIENEIEGVNQVAVNAKVGLNFATVLRSVLRQDPDVIMIGEIRDAETAQIAVRAAITGHMVLSTLHTNTAAGAISRLIDLGIEPFLLASALKGVLAQRLVRKLCEHCRKEVPFKPETLPAWAQGISKLYQGAGCDHCHFTGYKGRIAIFELAPLTEDIVSLIHARASDNDISHKLRQNGVKSIMEDGAEKINQGMTSIEEVLRVTTED